MFERRPSKIPGCFEIRALVFEDKRGRFVKTYQHEIFLEMGLNKDWLEEYYSVSHQGVLRGLHFQLPPHDHEKLVYCTSGEVFDVVLDLRVGSPTFGDHATFHLSAEVANMVYVPSGVAHGFFAFSEGATMMYKVSAVHAPQHDAGILWSSAGISWPSQNPVVSDRDAVFPALSSFVSPFVFTATGK